MFFLAVVDALHMSWLSGVGVICLIQMLFLAGRSIWTRQQIHRLLKRFAEEEDNCLAWRAQELGFCNTRPLFSGRYEWLLGCRYHEWFVPEDARIDRYHQFWWRHKNELTPYLVVVRRLVGSALSPTYELAWWDGGSEDSLRSQPALAKLRRLRRKAALRVITQIMRNRGAPAEMTAEEAAVGMRWLADCCRGAFLHCTDELWECGRREAKVELQALNEALWNAVGQG